MRLKRGAKRESCDFCHGRKMKCDRVSRARDGYATCSSCVSRQVECTVDGLGGHRIHQRQQERSQRSRGDSSLSGRGAVSSHLSPPFSTNSPALSHMPSQNTTTSTFTFDQTPESLFVDTSFELCSDSMMFLDQIFLGDIPSPMQNTSRSTIPSGLQPSSPAVEPNTADRTQTEPSNSSHPHALSELEPWLSSVIDPTLFVAALHAYFDFAALCMPIMIEDAFWEDFHARRCSSAVLLSVACRGLPFIDIAGKSEIQGHIARKFKESFLEAQASASSRGSVRLDNLESLALMVDYDYDYDETHDLIPSSHLGDLFMTHDSLVLMTLQFSKHYDLDADMSVQFAQAKERQKLLFWHVYGLDAFHSLDTKTASYIPENDICNCERILQHETGSYLDSILALAVIARKIVGSLCNATARAGGVKPNEVRSIYEYLHHWRNHNCPSHLQRQVTGQGVGGVQSISSTPSNRHILLQRALLWLLEINCYMQIESCITQYGFRDESSLEAEIIKLRAQYECLQAVQDVVEMCQWIGQCPAVDSAEVKPLVDLAPSILRNICAGMCIWVCLHAEKLILREPSDVSRGGSGSEDCENSTDKSRIKMYVKAAQTLRDTIAASSSHGDTVKILTRLDNQISSLLEKLK